MFVSILAIVVASIISFVAAYYQVIGLTAIFPASFIAILIMGAALELGKITTAIWLHTFWSKTGFLLKTYLISALAILMLITSMGIFGFLSRAHLEHTSGSVGSEIIISQLETSIDRQEKIITDAELVISQLDQTVQVLTDAQRIRGADGAIAVRESQREERTELNQIIDTASNEITRLVNEKQKIEIEQAKLEAEVGPIRYVAELIYGENPDKDLMEKSVRLLIIGIIFVFDPLAVALIIAGLYGLRISMKVKEPIVYQEPIMEPVEEVIVKSEPIKKVEVKKERGWLSD